MATHGTNPNFQNYYPRIFYDTLQTSAGGGASFNQKVMNPNDLPHRNAQVAWESGLLNPNANADCLGGSNYYTIGLGYGVEPMDLYVNRKCGGLLPHYTQMGSGYPGDSAYSSGGVYSSNKSGLRPVQRNIKPSASECNIGY